MDSEIIEKLKNRLSILEDVVKESNYASARKISSDIISISDFLDIPEYIFIGELFESIFDNLRNIDKSYELNEGIKNEINSKILSLINEIKNNPPPFEDTFKLNLLDNLVKIRSNVTKIQINYYLKKRKEFPSLEEFIERR